MTENQPNLETIMRALLLAALKGIELGDKVQILSQAGWTNAQISAVTGLKPKAIGMRKARNNDKRK